MLLSRENAKRIVEENGRAIGRDINIMDENGVIIASTDPARINAVHEGARRLLRDGLSMLAVHSGNEFPGSQEGVNLPVSLHGETVGVIGISGPPEEVAVFGGIIRRMTEIQLEGMQQQEQEEQLQHARDLFWEYLLFSDTLDPTEAEMRGKLLGIDPSLQRTAVELCLLRPDSTAAGQLSAELESSKLLSFLRIQLAGSPQAFCTVLRQHILLFLPGAEDDALTAVHALAEKLKYCFPLQLYGGISAPSCGAGTLRRCFQEAKDACRTAMLSGTQRIALYRDVSLESILESVPVGLKQQMLEKVFSGCTQEETGELLDTLQLYFRCGGNTEQAAQLQCVHKNTFLYHIEKLKKKTGYSLRDPRQSALLYCCLRFARGHGYPEQK